MSFNAKDPPAPVKARPQSVLFACSHNSVRSPMAEALARDLFGKSIFFASAGLRAGDKDPFAAAVMDEIGIDMSKHRPCAFDDLEDMNFDLIVSLSPEAHHRALEFTRSLPLDVMFWRTYDPTVVQGSREVILDSYRGVRDALRQRIIAAFGLRPLGIW